MKARIVYGAKYKCDKCHTDNIIVMHRNKKARNKHCAGCGGKVTFMGYSWITKSIKGTNNWENIYDERNDKNK